MEDKIICNKSDLVNAANSIRSKLSVTNTYKVSELSGAIDSIPNGGTPSLQSKSVTYTSNGTATITPGVGYDGLSSVDVTVDVASGGGVETCTVSFSSNIPDIQEGYAHSKISLTVFENNEIITKTVSSVNNITVSNVVLNSVGFVIYNTNPRSISTHNANNLGAISDIDAAFTFTGNASIAATFEATGGGGGAN